jgi:eukaryotic-like serine/threonine-protein kinase
MPTDSFGNRIASPDDLATVDAAPLPSVVAGRYRVIESIGGGGMGRVFRARDQSLKRDVAIKILSPDLARRPRFGEQLLREARAVAQLHHPRIATVYDVVEDGGSLCIVMEYLDGETLAHRLQRGPLTGTEAIRHGREIASALAHAHTAGIVHCDLKPANIFLTDDGVKVLDFGLARVIRRSPEDSTDGIGASPAFIGSRAGTPAYMSPEQRVGLPLDHRTDIYSFGIVLGEMSTGSRPGAAGNVACAADTGAGRLAPIIQRALAPSPADRYQTADEIEVALRSLEYKSRPPWRSPYFLTAAALVAAAAALQPLLRPSSPSSAGHVPPVVAVSRFMSSSGDTSMSYLAAGLSDIVSRDLGASNAVVAARSDRVVSSAEEAAALARELGVNILVLGRVERNDTQIAVEVRRFVVGSRSLGEATSFSRPVRDLAGIRQALTTAVFGQLGSAGASLREPPAPERLLPASMDGFEEYAQARFFLDQLDVEANIDHARTLLERLVAREPGFALAHASLGEAAWRKWQATKDPKWSDDALKNALEALRLAPDQPEVRYAVALIYQGTGRRAEALSELEHVARTRPTNDDVQRLMGRLYADMGRLDEGLAALRRAIALRPGYWGNHAALGNAAFRAGFYEQAIAAFERYCDLRPDSASAHQRLGTAYHADGNLEAALRSYQRALEISPNANAYSNLGTLHFDAGRYGEAVKAYTRAVDLEPRNPSLHRNLGDAMARIGNARGAFDQYSQAITKATEALRVNPRDASTLSLKAVGLARTGHLSEALVASAAAVALAPRDTDVLFENALILTLAGRKVAAVDALSRAVDAGYNPKRLENELDLAPLSDLSGFRRLVGGQR